MNPTVVHTGNAGDLIYSLPAIHSFSKIAGEPVAIYLAKGVPAFYYEGATHPVRSENGVFVSLNAYMIKMLTPLLEAQEYISFVKTWDNEEYDVMLTDIRDPEAFVNMPFGDIRRWYFYLFPNLVADLSKPYLAVPDTEKDLAKGKIIVNRSQRYLNKNIDYSFFKTYESLLLFAGTDEEHVIFMRDFDLDFPRLVVNDFLELTQAIKQSLFVVGNQSFVFSLAETMKHPRVCEICHFAPNVIPVGEHAYDFYGQPALEYYVYLLYNTLKDK